ncbi:MAG TPA: T9SS type A sorting domain-containing protein [Saprospiraceae bacterium]|nr:T9SS type A sorting domain-containing protein [Saprospiraceae bacterium]
MMKGLGILTLCLALITQGFGQTTKAFYVGHSLSDQIPDMVQSLSDATESLAFDWVYQSIPGAPLRWQWDRKEANDFIPIDPHMYGFYDEVHGLPNGSFDLLILTESVPRYSLIIEETYRYADSFMNYALQFNPDIRLYINEPWHCLESGTPTGCDYDVDSAPWRQRLRDDLPMWQSVVDSLNQRYPEASDVCLIPSGQALGLLSDRIDAGEVPVLGSIEDLFSDRIHLTDQGKYFIACVHFAMIHRQSSVGLTHQTQYWWGGDFEAPSMELAQKMQEIALEAVENYPGSCYTTTYQEEKTTNEFLVYPNPAYDYIFLNQNNGHAGTEIFDLYGRMLKKVRSAKIYVGDLPNGVYWLIQGNQRALIHVLH